MAGEVVKVQGLDELLAKLREIPVKLRSRYLRNWLASGARIVQREAKAKTPVLSVANAKKAPYRKPGTVRDAIRVRTSKRDRKTGDVGVFVNVKPLSKGAIRSFKAGGGGSGFKNPNDPYYWRWLNWGRESRVGEAARERVARVKRVIGGVRTIVVKGVRARGAKRAVGPMRAFKFLEAGAAKLPDALRAFEAAAAKWFDKVDASGRVE